MSALTLSAEQAAQAELIALRIAARRAELGHPMLSVSRQLEADREIIRSLTEVTCRMGVDRG